MLRCIAPLMPRYFRSSAPLRVGRGLLRRTVAGAILTGILSGCGGGGDRSSAGTDSIRAFPSASAPVGAAKHRIVFFAPNAKNGGKEEDLFILNGDGSGLKNLTEGRTLHPGMSAKFDALAVSRDGGAIVFTCRQTPINSQGQGATGPSLSEVYRINPDGTGMLRVATDALPLTSPAVSYNGERIAFIVERSLGFYYFSLDVVNGDGSNRREIGEQMDNPGERHGKSKPQFLPDSSRLMFIQVLAAPGFLGGPVPFGIYSINDDGSDIRRQGNFFGVGLNYFISPDGKTFVRILFNGIGFASSPGAIPYTLDTQTIRKVDDDLSPEGKQIILPPPYLTGFTPDGQSLYGSDDYNDYIVPLDGSTPIRLGTMRPPKSTYPVYSPDGTLRIYTTNRIDIDMVANSRSDLYISNADGSSATRIAANLNVTLPSPGWIR